jgi:beta-phosphoglucomutase
MYKYQSFDGVLFDLDGVIIKSMEQHLKAWQYAFAQYGAQISASDFYDLEGRGVRVVAEILAKRFEIDIALAPKITKEKNEYYDKIVNIEFYEGLFPLLQFLKDTQKKTAIITGSIRSRVEVLLQGKLNGFFQGYVTSEDVINTKPFPEPFLKGAELLQLKPEQCIVIENAPLGVTAAKRAGMTVFAVTSTVPAEILSEADYVLPTLIDVHAKLAELTAVT